MLQDDDTVWIGAWWIGFLLCACLAFIVALTMLFFPRRLPLEDRDRNQEDQPDFASFGAQLKGTNLMLPFIQQTINKVGFL